MNRFIIKLEKKEDILALESIKDIEDKTYLSHYIYENSDEFDTKSSEYYMFYQSPTMSIKDFLNKSEISIPEDQITEVYDLDENTLKEFENKSIDTIYVTNFPRNFTSENLLELISNVPDNSIISTKPKIERLPCVFKILIEDNIEWIESILRYIPCIQFGADDISMIVETNCINVPVIHFMNLPQSFTTIEYFVEIMKNDLGDFQLFEQNETKDKKPLAFNISYKTNDEAWDIIDQLNFQPFEGKEIRVNHFIDIKFLQEMSKYNIKVTNYEGELNSFDIYENFQQFGSIYSIHNNNPTNDENDENEIPQKLNEENNFFCVQYYLKENAIEAVINASKAFNMKNLTLTTKEAGIVVYNFANTITIEKVKSIFPCATKIVIKKSSDRNSRPFVFINFICKEDCDDAISKCKNIYSDHLRLMCVPQTMTKVEAFKEKRRDEENCQKKFTVFINGIPKNIFAEDVIQKCSVFGDIDSAVFIDLKKKKSVAKISFSSEESFQKAVNSSICFDNVTIKMKKYDPQFKK